MSLRCERRLLRDCLKHCIETSITARRDVKLFEMGRVFEQSDGDERPLERELLGLVMSGAVAPDDWRGRAQSGVLRPERCGRSGDVELEHIRLYN